jgi:hypothetical protein
MTRGRQANTRWVIFAGPEQRQRSGTHYIASDGTVTGYREEAAKFSTSDGAFDFAKEKGITLDGVSRYVGQESFD